MANQKFIFDVIHDKAANLSALSRLLLEKWNSSDDELLVANLNLLDDL